MRALLIVFAIVINQTIGGGYLLEFLFGLGIPGIEVGMQLFRKFAIGLLNSSGEAVGATPRISYGSFNTVSTSKATLARLRGWKRIAADLVRLDAAGLEEPLYPVGRRADAHPKLGRRLMPRQAAFDDSPHHPFTKVV